jgi:hypothetical protein
MYWLIYSLLTKNIILSGFGQGNSQGFYKFIARCYKNRIILWIIIDADLFYNYKVDY